MLLGAYKETIKHYPDMRVEEKWDKKRVKRISISGLSGSEDPVPAGRWGELEDAEDNLLHMLLGASKETIDRYLDLIVLEEKWKFG